MPLFLLKRTLTFVATLAFAPHLDMGILFGVMVAIGLFLHRRMRPRVAIVAWQPDAGSPGEPAPPGDGFVAVRFDGALIFVNVAYFEDAVLDGEVFPDSAGVRTEALLA